MLVRREYCTRCFMPDSMHDQQKGPTCRTSPGSTRSWKDSVVHGLEGRYNRLEGMGRHNDREGGWRGEASGKVGEG